MSENYRLDRPQGLACPECGGVAEPLLLYRCHIGHVFTAETMQAAQFDTLEAKLETCLAALNERAELCRQIIENPRAQGEDLTKLEIARTEAIERVQVIKRLLESEWTETGRE
jgi:two-component system, chemotaxis family, protein-glutamate methylesterase/glutaminase